MAYEDIGLASPQAGAHTLAAIQTAEKVGFPEARIPLANAVIELCLSPKSNSAIMAIDAALADIRQGKKWRSARSFARWTLFWCRKTWTSD